MSGIFHEDRVLIVDDNPQNIQVIASTLNECRYSMAFATSGADAIKILENKKYDLILLDVMMPEMNGFEVCSYIKENLNLDIPIIFLSAKSDEDSIVKGFEVGGVDYIVKPFNTMELSARVKTHLELKRAKFELEMDKKYFEAIFNSQQNITIITDKNSILDANEAFFKFTHFKDISHFKEKYDCICDLFEVVDNPEFVSKNKSGLNWVEYITSRGDKVTKAIMKNGNKNHIFVITIKALNFDIYNIYLAVLTDVTELEDKRKKLLYLASTDQLTNIANRLKLNQFLDKKIDRLKRKEIENISVIFFDIDFFKKINDEYGHKVGDTVLVELSSLVSKELKKPNLLARWGGEEFVIVLINYDIDMAFEFADKLRVKIRENNFSKIKRLTCSFGVSEFLENDTDNTILTKADKSLYLAKENGRDRVEKG